MTLCISVAQGENLKVGDATLRIEVKSDRTLRVYIDADKSVQVQRESAKKRVMIHGG